MPLLGEMHADAAQDLHSFLVFHPLGDRADAHDVDEVVDRFQHGPVDAVACEVARQRAVDLQ